MSNPYPPYGSDPYQQSGYSQPQGDYSQYGQSQYNQGYGQPAYGQPAYVQPVMVAQPQTNTKAIISLILGICSFVIVGNLLTGIPAIICGHMALREIQNSGGLQEGRPLALVGLILGYVATIGTLAFCAFWVFVVILAIGSTPT